MWTKKAGGKDLIVKKGNSWKTQENTILLRRMTLLERDTRNAVWMPIPCLSEVRLKMITPHVTTVL